MGRAARYEQLDGAHRHARGRRTIPFAARKWQKRQSRDKYEDAMKKSSEGAEPPSIDTDAGKTGNNTERQTTNRRLYTAQIDKRPPPVRDKKVPTRKGRLMRDNPRPRLASRIEIIATIAINPHRIRSVGDAEALPNISTPTVDRALDDERGVDQAYVSKGLREVAQCCTAMRLGAPSEFHGLILPRRKRKPGRPSMATAS